MKPIMAAESDGVAGPGHTLDHSMARLFIRWRKKADRAVKAGTAIKNKLAGVAAAGLLAATLAGSPVSAAPAGTGDRPNIIHIMSDDQVWWNLRCYGQTSLTPNLDSLARGGVIFTRATPVCPICAPVRMTLLTGQYPTRFNPYMINDRARFPVGTPNIGRSMTEAGYQTAYIGKTHFRVTNSGIPNTNVPGQVGALGYTYPDMAHPYLDSSGCHFQVFPPSIDSALSFITRNRDNPFVAQIYVTPTHGPHEAPPEYISRVSPWGDVTDAMTTWLDDNIGRIVSRVDSLGIRGRTVIIYSSDNATSRSGAAGLGNKTSVYDESVPFIVNCPGRFSAGITINQVIQDVDFFPTILDLCDVAQPAGVTLDGRSFLPLLEEQAVSWRTSSYYECEYARAVLRNDKWKYIAVRQIPDITFNLTTVLNSYGGTPDLLFNLAADSAEMVNLAADPAYADTLTAMKALLSGYMQTMTYDFGEFNDNTGSETSLPGYTKRTPASFTVYNIKGQTVRRLTGEVGDRTSGLSRLTKGLPNGVYAYKMAVNGVVYTGKKAVVR